MMKIYKVLRDCFVLGAFRKMGTTIETLKVLNYPWLELVSDTPAPEELKVPKPEEPEKEVALNEGDNTYTEEEPEVTEVPEEPVEEEKKTTKKK